MLTETRKYKYFFERFIAILKQQAFDAKLEMSHLESEHESNETGYIMAYYSVFFLLKHQASVFEIDENEIGLADIDPERDLLGLHKNPDLE